MSGGSTSAPCCHETWHIGPETKWPPFPDDIFKWIFLDENLWILLRISLKFVPKVQIYNISALVQIMAWRRPGDKPLSEPMMVSLLTHICVTRPQWVNLKSKPKSLACLPSCVAPLFGAVLRYLICIQISFKSILHCVVHIQTVWW